MHSCVQQWLAIALTDKEKYIIEKECYIQFLFLEFSVWLVTKSFAFFSRNNNKKAMTVNPTVFATITSTNQQDSNSSLGWLSDCWQAHGKCILNIISHNP